MKKNVFLGGTCNGSTWRDDLIPLLTNIDYFNPVVPDWTPECQLKEVEARNTSDFVLYVLTPKMTGVYSVAEVVDDSNKRPKKTIMLFLDKDGDAAFTAHQTRSLIATAKMVTTNGGKTFTSLQDVADFLNNQ